MKRCFISAWLFPVTLLMQANLVAGVTKPRRTWGGQHMPTTGY